MDSITITPYHLNKFTLNMLILLKLTHDLDDKEYGTSE